MIRLLHGLLERVRVLLGKERFEAELDAELQFHIEESTRRYVESGMAARAARRAALRDLGGVEMTKEQVRNETGVRFLQDFAQDVRYGLRTLAKRPGFTLALVATIGLAIGSNAAVFSVVHSILLDPLPFYEPDRIVRVYNNYPGARVTGAENSVRDFHDRREGVDAFADVALFTEIAHSMGRGDAAQHVFAMQVTPSFFSVFGGVPAIGTLFPDELTRGAANYAVIGDDLWRSAFGGDPGVVGSTVFLDGGAYELMGVLPPDFEFATWDAQIYTPLVFAPESRFGPARNADRFNMVARLHPDATVEGAQAQLDALNVTLIEGYSVEDRSVAVSSGFGSVVRGYLTDLTGPVRRPLLLLWLGALIILVAAVANVTTLFLIRATGRRSEISYRLALGAGRGRVFRQLLTESLLISAVGGTVGLALAAWSLRFLAAFEVYEIPRIDSVEISPTMVAAGVAAALAFGMIATLLPARGLLWGSDGQLGGTSRTSLSERPSRVHHVLVGLQISFAFVLVMTTGLLVQTLRELHSIQLGFDPSQVAVGATNLPANSYPDWVSRAQFGHALVDALREHPDVAAAAIATQLPFSDVSNQVVVIPDGMAASPGEIAPRAYATAITPEYFETLDMAMVAGRAFTTSDRVITRGVAVVDEDLARALWPDASPIGRQVWLGERTGDPRDVVEIVGVVSSIRQNSLTERQLPGAIYVPFSQQPSSFFRIAVRTLGSTSDVPAIARETMTRLDPALLYYWVDDMAGAVDGSLLLRRLPMRLLSAFSVVALFLVVMGVYGVTTYVVSTRTAELGLRMALGGTPKGIAGRFALEWSSVTAGGLLLGLLGVLLMLPVVRSLLFGTSGLDVGVASAAIALVVAATGLSFAWPIRRALRIDPARALTSTD